MKLLITKQKAVNSNFLWKIEFSAKKSSDCLHLQCTFILNVTLKMANAVRDILNKINFEDRIKKSYFIQFPLSLRDSALCMLNMFNICSIPTRYSHWRKTAGLRTWIEPEWKPESPYKDRLYKYISTELP